MFGNGPRTATVAAVAVLLVTAGCTGGDSDGDAPGNSVAIAITEPRHLLPSDTVDVSGRQVLSALFQPLVEFDAEGNPVPAAAEAVTPDRTARIWTIKLKPGLKFGNGEPVTADSYIDAWNYGAYGPNDQSASASFERIEGYADMQSRDAAGQPPQVSTLSGLKKVSDTSFTVTLSAPFAGWAFQLNGAAFYPLPKAAFSAPGVIADGFEDAVVGNGPFKIKGKWEHDSQIVVERVAGFPGRAPKVDAVTWKIYSDPGAEYADLVSADVDVLPQIPLERLAAAPGDLGDRLQRSPNSAFQFVAFPKFQKEFASPDVRKALSMAIDRKAMTDQIFLGSQTPATSFVSPVVAGYRADSCGDSCVHDAAKAKQLYTAAGGPPDIKITYNADGGHKVWVDAMCAQITASLGVNCAGQGEPKLADLLAKLEKKEPVGLIRLTWNMDFPLMENYLGPLYTTNGSVNSFGYSNTAFDSLVKEGSESATVGVAIKKWQQAEDILAEDMPVIPLRFGQNVFGHSTRVKGVAVDSAQRVDLYSIQLAG
jgi:ABC-type oligopeptide transport system substrate-binding subunit